MQNVVETRLSEMASTNVADGSSICASNSSLSRFCQLQVDQIAAQSSITWAQIVHYDPALNTHQEVFCQAGGVDAGMRAELQSAINLTDFPPVLTLMELPLKSPCWSAYFCPLGYRNYQPEYILVLANPPLSSALRDYIISCAKLTYDHFELGANLYHQKAENQLLEQIFHRVGHQLRSPLSLISLYAENLRLELSGRQAEQQTVIRDTVQDLLSNLNDLIYCGKSSQLRIALHDIQALMVETIQELQPWLTEKQLQIVYAPVSITLRVDRVQIKQVFTNLLSNAIHFSPRAGIIYINWQVFQSEMLIQITDQGQGLSESDLKKIFTPFYSQRPGGTGLGLTIAQKIMLDHQGSLWAQNSPAGGAQFSLTLPRQ